MTSDSGTNVTFTIKLLKKPSSEVSLHLVSLNTSEIIVSPLNLSFTEGNWNIEQIVTLQGVDDLEVDGDKVVNINLLPVTSSDLSYNGLDPAHIIVINIDND